MSRDVDSLRDIVLSARRALGYVEGLSQAEFEQQVERQDSLMYRILVMGEATKRLSPEFREKHPIIPWRQVAGMRDVLIHEYDQIDLDLLWEVSQHSIPDLLSQLEPLLASLENS